MKNPPDDNSIKADVLQAHEHAKLTSEEVAKAIARHKREHPGKPEPAQKKKTGKH